ncbi:MAG: nucleoside hydrolase [Proteobacteria bacterium]|nr:nucleoside hydrolase [Pseudomonadota bacterium]
MEARPLIIDCDPGQDDAVALLLAFASPELEVLGVTTVAGNVPLELTAANARRVCELAGRGDMAVYAGCPRPILRPLATAAHVHGEDGLEGANLPPPAMALQSRHAVDYLVEQLMASGGDVTLAALGPLTNVALAIVAAPAIVPRLREIVIMGGAIEGGNVTAHAEFNIHTDPHAAAVVFSAGARLTMIGLDATHRAIATRERVAAIRAIGRAPAQTVAGMLEQHLEDPAGRHRGGGAALHDPCVIAYLLQPALFETQSMRVDIETEDPASLGQTVVGREEKRPTNANVAVGIDAEGFFALLTEQLARL